MLHLLTNVGHRNVTQAAFATLALKRPNRNRTLLSSMWRRRDPDPDFRLVAVNLNPSLGMGRNFSLHAHRCVAVDAALLIVVATIGDHTYSSSL